MKQKIDKTFAGLLTIFFLSFGIFITIFLFDKTPLNQVIKAAPELIPSTDKSLILAYPLNAKADGNEKITINVFLRNKDGLPVANKNVFLKATLGNIKNNPQKTGKDGKASFILTTTVPGISEITASVDNNISLNQKISIKFE